jgi:hypothetical protein
VSVPPILRETSTASRRLVVILSSFILGVLHCAPGPALAGLPGYFEWVLWRETRGEDVTDSPEPSRKLEWIVGPYPTLSECERERDRLADATARRERQPTASARPLPAGGVAVVIADRTTIRLFCVPDTVNPRVDRRWP